MGDHGKTKRIGAGFVRALDVGYIMILLFYYGCAQLLSARVTWVEAALNSALRSRVWVGKENLNVSSESDAPAGKGNDRSLLATVHRRMSLAWRGVEYGHAWTLVKPETLTKARWKAELKGRFAWHSLPSPGTGDAGLCSRDEKEISHTRTCKLPQPG